jgi:hypothetical protein
VLGLNVPASGGGYFRLYPLFWTLSLVKRIQRAESPYLFYVHPWELDPQQPRLRAGSRIGRFRHYVNLARNERKLDALLRTVRFGRITDAIGVGQAAGLPAKPRQAGSLPLRAEGACWQLAPTSAACQP